MNACVAAGAAQPARCHRPAAVLRDERLGRDADLQLQPVACAVRRRRADRLQLQTVLLLGDGHNKDHLWVEKTPVRYRCLLTRAVNVSDTVNFPTSYVTIRGLWRAPGLRHSL